MGIEQGERAPQGLQLKGCSEEEEGDLLSVKSLRSEV